MKTILFFLFTGIITSCHSHTDWQQVKYNHKPCQAVGTDCTTSHQGEHAIRKCDVYIDSDTLVIHFPAELPAYWGSLTVKVHGGKFKATFDGVPFSLDALTFETVRSALTLGKTTYAAGDTLCGTCGFTFEETNPQTGQHSKFYYKGDIAEIVRSKDFDPFDDVNLVTFDLPTAQHELGEPLNSESYAMSAAYGEFRVELLNYFPVSGSILMRELTWDISDTRDISDEGKERLTIWYACAKDKKYYRDAYAKLPAIWNNADSEADRWLPVDIFKWTTDWEF